jgi:hypothetical protein
LVALIAALALSLSLPTTVSSQGILEEANSIAVQVGAIRGLPPLAPIKSGFKSREELRQVVMAKIAEEYSAERLADDGAMLVRLGMLPEGTDYGHLIVEVLSEQIAGFYDQKTEELYLVEGADEATQRITIAHEIFHGIQDQYFDLDTVSPPPSGPAGRDRNDDFILATTALIEGDATILMFDFTYRAQGLLPQNTSLVDSPLFDSFVAPLLTDLDPAMFGQSSPKLSAAPPWLGKSLVFPYVRGMIFVASLRHNGSWSRADAAYTDPPRSTEQILHPDKYLAGHGPVLVVLDNEAIADAVSGATGRTWHARYDNVMGEFQLGLWLESLGIQSKRAQRAAQGWGGDRLIGVHDETGATMAVLVSVWDSEEAAVRFAETLEAAVALRHTDLETETRGGAHGTFVCGRAGRDTVVIERWGEWVVWSEGLPAGAPLKAVREVIWSTRQIGEY